MLLLTLVLVGAAALIALVTAAMLSRGHGGAPESDAGAALPPGFDQTGVTAPGTAGSGAAYGSSERALLLDLARRSLIAAVTGERAPTLPANASAALRERRGAFVTLEIGDELRGCIGHIFPKEPLGIAVIHNARSAAVEDPRFAPVVPAELGRITIEVSVLSLPEPLGFTSPEDLLQKLRPGIDGVVLDIHGRRSTFLPQVWGDLADPVEFLDHLSAKGGSARHAWRGSGVTILTYRAEAFTESGAEHQ